MAQKASQKFGVECEQFLKSTSRVVESKWIELSVVYFDGVLGAPESWSSSFFGSFQMFSLLFRPSEKKKKDAKRNKNF